MLETRLDIYCRNEIGGIWGANCWHGKGQIVENTCKNAKPGPQHLLIKSCLHISHLHGRGYCHWACVAAAFAGPFFLIRVSQDALVGPNFAEKGLLHCQTLGISALPDQTTERVKAAYALLRNACKLSLPGLWQGPLAHIFGPIEANYLLSLIKINLTMKIIPKLALERGKQHDKTRANVT